MGEEVDDLATGTSKLKDELLSLTGVDIMKDANTYKSTYQILLEISKVWDRLSDVQQATVLEDLAGKRNASVIKSVITNVKDLEGAYNAANNAEGSLGKAYGIYLDTIEGRIGQLTATFQTFSKDTIGSNTIKYVLQAANALLKVFDVLAKIDILLPTIAASVLTIKNAGEPKKTGSINTPAIPPVATRNELAA